MIVALYDAGGSEREVYQRLIERLDDLKGRPRGALIAIDGRCGSGKSTLAQKLAQMYSGAVIHMDDFYLPLERRKSDWMECVGGNMDFDRLCRQVLQPLRSGDEVRYRPYVCKTGSYAGEIVLQPGMFVVLEGSYSHHPALETEFDLKIFLTCGAEVQEQRLRIREGERFQRFREIWIPLEERYFALYTIPERADLVLDMGTEEEREGTAHAR